MKYILRLTLFTFILCTTSEVIGQAYQSSVGARLGTFFTGSYKTFINENSAIEAVAGFESFGGASFILAGGFYEIHNPLSIEGADLQWYYGGGGYVLLGGFTGIVPSGIVGLEYVMDDAPVNFFIDAVPSLFIGNGGSDFHINGAIGARYILN